MDYKTYRISEAVTLSHIKTDCFKKARFSVTFRSRITAEESPLTSLLISAAMLGTEKHPTFRDICCRIEDLYAAGVSDINVKLGNYHLVGLVASILNDEYMTEADKESGISILSGIMELFSELLIHPLFRKENVETEKTNQINRINSRKNDAFGYAKHRFVREMFKDEPCGLTLTGEVNQIKAITADDLKEQCKKLIKSSPVEFFYCGTADAERVIELIKKNFGDIGAPFDDSDAIKTYKALPEEPRYIEESGLYRQGNMLVGFRTGVKLDDKEFYATELMNQIYGDGSTSKLFINLREKKSLCYFCASTYDEVRGTILVGCGINNDDYTAALDEIFAQLEEMKRGNITAAEIESARETIYSDCRAAEDHPADYEDFGRTQRLFGGPISIEEYRLGIMAVTKDEIVEAARRIKPDTVYFLRGEIEDGGDELE